MHTILACLLRPMVKSTGAVQRLTRLRVPRPRRGVREDCGERHKQARASPARFLAAPCTLPARRRGDAACAAGLHRRPLSVRAGRGCRERSTIIVPSAGLPWFRELFNYYAGGTNETGCERVVKRHRVRRPAPRGPWRRPIARAAAGSSWARSSPSRPRSSSSSWARTRAGAFCGSRRAAPGEAAS